MTSEHNTSPGLHEFTENYRFCYRMLSSSFISCKIVVNENIPAQALNRHALKLVSLPSVPIQQK